MVVVDKKRGERQEGRVSSLGGNFFEQTKSA